MKKNILIIVLIVLSTLSLVFGFIQKSRADRLMTISEKYQRLAEEASLEASRQSQIARQERMKADAARIEAMNQYAIAEQNAASGRTKK